MRLVTFRAHPPAGRLGAGRRYVIDLALLGPAALPDDMLSHRPGPGRWRAARLLEQFRGTWPVGAALPRSVKLLTARRSRGSNTRHMLFKVPFLISDISAGITLEPGDIIAAPEGVGAGRSPGLWPGDVVEAGVEGITLRHPVVCEAGIPSNESARCETPGHAVSRGKT